MADRFLRSGNPGLNDKTFANAPIAGAAEPMTLSGTINKSFLLLIALMLSALWPWSQYLSGGDVAVIGPALTIGALGGLVLALIISFKPTAAPVLALPYAVLEGLAIGSMSALLESRYPGIAIQAVGLTFGVFAAMLIAYRTGLIRATERFRAIVIAATGGIALVYLITMVLGLFHVQTPIFSITDSSPLSIGVSLVIVGVAALNLILDFDIIETGVARGAPRYMEWYCGFGLLVTLVWLYMEILRLLAKMRRD